MLVTSKEIMTKARENAYSVISPSIDSEMCLAAATEVAEEERAPLIYNIRVAEKFQYGSFVSDFRECVQQARRWAERASVPIAVHLDHAHTLEDVATGINYGYTSITLEPKIQGFDEYKEQVRQWTELVHAAGISVEGVLPRLTWEQLGKRGEDPEIKARANTESDLAFEFTDPELLKEFVDYTGVDTIAVWVGNRFDRTKKMGAQPALINLELLKELSDAVDIPLMLHGGSSIKSDNFGDAQKLGIARVNVGTALRRGAAAAVRRATEDDANQNSFYLIRDGYKAALPEYVRLSGSAGKADE